MKPPQGHPTKTEVRNFFIGLIIALVTIVIVGYLLVLIFPSPMVKIMAPAIGWWMLWASYYRLPGTVPGEWLGADGRRKGVHEIMRG